MADGFLETHQADYEARRDAYLQGKYRHTQKNTAAKTPRRNVRRTIERPDDEAL